jgi:hypothetical protein
MPRQVLEIFRDLQEALAAVLAAGVLQDMGTRARQRPPPAAGGGSTRRTTRS